MCYISYPKPHQVLSTSHSRLVWLGTWVRLIGRRALRSCETRVEVETGIVVDGGLGLLRVLSLGDRVGTIMRLGGWGVRWPAVTVVMLRGGRLTSRLGIGVVVLGSGRLAIPVEVVLGSLSHTVALGSWRRTASVSAIVCIIILSRRLTITLRSTISLVLAISV